MCAAESKRNNSCCKILTLEYKSWGVCVRHAHGQKRRRRRGKAEVIMSGGWGKLYRKLEVNGGVWGISSRPPWTKTGRADSKLGSNSSDSPLLHYCMRHRQLKTMECLNFKKGSEPSNYTRHLCLLGGPYLIDCISDSISKLQCIQNMRGLGKWMNLEI